ncbi:MAG: PaaI family thioesterase [Myxococcota bacterium]
MSESESASGSDSASGSETTSGNDASWTDEARALADEVRELVETLSTREIEPEALREAARAVRHARERISGAPRARWYDDPLSAFDSPVSRRAYLELSPIRGRLNPVAPPIEVEFGERPDGERIVRGRARLGVRYEGPPHGVHGGWVAALFDEVLGQAQALSGGPGVTAVLNVKYRHVTPIEEDLVFEGWVHESRGRRVIARATCHAGDTLTADAEGIFMRVDFGEVQERMRQRRESRD